MTLSSTGPTKAIAGNSKAERLMRCLTTEMINYHLGTDGDDLAESYECDEDAETGQDCSKRETQNQTPYIDLTERPLRPI